MMKVFFSDDEDFLLGKEDLQEKIFHAANTVASVYGLDDNTQVSISLIGDEEIRQINHEYRGVDRVTDVISFALEEGEEMEIIGGSADKLLGEIVISFPQMTRQAEEYGHSQTRELIYLLVHGFLHLLGYDHIDENDRQQMREEEEFVMEKLDLLRE